MYSNFDFSNYERNISDNFDANYSFVEEGLPLPIFYGELYNRERIWILMCRRSFT